MLIRHNQSVLKGYTRLFKDENAKLVFVLTQQSVSFLLHPVFRMTGDGNTRIRVRGAFLP